MLLLSLTVPLLPVPSPGRAGRDGQVEWERGWERDSCIYKSVLFVTVPPIQYLKSVFVCVCGGGGEGAAPH